MIRFLKLLLNRLRHERHLRRHGWAYTEKPMLGKRLFADKTNERPKP